MTEKPPESSAASNRTVEICTSVLFLVFGALIMWDSWRIGATWGADGPGSGYFPFYVGLLMNIASVANLIVAWRMDKEASFVSRESLKSVVIVLVPLAIYVGVMQFLGMYVASAIFIAVFMRWQGKFSVLKSVASGLGVSIALFLMFEIWFSVPLLKGPLEAALGF